MSSSLNGSFASSARASSMRLDDAAGEPLRPLDDLLHPLLEVREVLGGERAIDGEVVVEAVLDRRADAELGLGEFLLDGLREHVRRRVADHAAAVVGVRRDRLDLDVGVGHPGQVLELALGVTDHDDDVRALARVAGLPNRRTGRSPRGHPDEGGWGGGCGGAHGDVLLGEVCGADMVNVPAHVIGPAVHTQPSRPARAGSPATGSRGRSTFRRDRTCPSNHSVARTTAHVSSAPAPLTTSDCRENQSMNLS